MIPWALFNASSALLKGPSCLLATSANHEGCSPPCGVGWDGALSSLLWRRARASRAVSIARVLSVSVSAAVGTPATVDTERGVATMGSTRLGVRKAGSAIWIRDPQRLHFTTSRLPRSFSSEICSRALQFSQLNCIAARLYYGSPAWLMPV